MSNLQSGASEAQMIELLNSIKFPVMSAGGGFAPIGTINFFDASVAPLGWLACDGSTHNISDYPELATFYASVHGASNFYGGDGTTTFAVPDLRGEFLRGTGTNGHTNQGSGANVGVHQDGTLHYATNGGLYQSNIRNVTGVSQNGSAGHRNDPIIEHVNPDHATDAVYGRYSEGNSAQADDLGIEYTSRPTNTSFLICVKATLSDANFDSYTIYSPNEHQVGWWQEEVSGVLKQKPIYEKTLSVGDLSTGTYNYTHNISNIDRVVSYLGTAMRGDGSQFVFPSINMASSNYNASVYCIYTSSVVVFSVGSGASGNDRFQDCKLTIRYTKTTDEWQVV